MSGLDFSQDQAKAIWKALQVRANQLERDIAAAAAAEKNFYKFVEIAWPYFEPAKKFIPCWHVGAICEHLQACGDGQIQTLVITVPPGSAKSVTACVAFPAWQWIPSRNPRWRATFASYGSDLATRDSVRCRNLMETGWYREGFKVDWHFSTAQNEKTYFVNDRTGFRMSTSITGRGTGWRGDALICDDPLNAKERRQESSLAACIDWWDNVMFNRFIDMEKAVRILIMQRLSDRDLAGHILRRGGCEHLKIPMEYQPKRSVVTSIWQDPRKEENELMCEKVFPRDVVEELKKNSESWESQYQQEPVVDGGSILKAHRWNYWKPRSLDLPRVKVRLPDGSIEERPAVDLPDDFDLTLSSWDCAFKDSARSDFVVGFVVSVRGSSRYVRDRVRDRMDCPATIRAIRSVAGRFPEARLHLIEDKANGPAAEQSLRDEVSGIVLVNPEGGKVSRAQGAAYELESGQWFLPHPMIADWVGDPEEPMKGGFLREAAVFPFGGKEHDDAVDSWSMAGIRIQKENFGGIFGCSEKDIRVDQVEIGEKWPRIYGLAVMWNEVGVVWIARKPDTGEHYMYAEYTVAAGNPAQHAAEIQKQGKWVPGAMHATERDDHAMVRSYRTHGLKLDTYQEHDEAEIADLKEALSSGKLKICANLQRFFDQFRQFRRNDRGKLPTANVSLIRAMSVAWHGRSRMRAQSEAKTKAAQPALPSRQDWMGH